MKNPLRTLLADLGIGPRIVLIFALVFSGMGGLGLVLMRNSLLPTFERMESEMALDSSWRVVKTFEQLMSAPAELSNDWALWDDMYLHIQRPNKEFATSNYSDEVLTTAKYHAVLILDRENKIVGFGSRPLSNGTKAQSQDLASPLIERLNRFPLKAKRTECGMVSVASALSAVCWTGVLKSSGQGPMMGTVGIAVDISAEKLKTMARSVGANFTLTSLDAPLTKAPTGLVRKLPAFEYLSNTELIQQVSADSIVTHYLLHDLNDTPLAWVQIHMDRTLLLQGRKVIQDVLIQLTVVALVTGLVLLLTVQLWLVGPVNRLRNAVANIGLTKRWDKRLDVDRPDEIGELTHGINSLLEVLRNQMDALREISSTDALTGIGNRRQFDARLGEELSRLGRRTGPLSLLLVDVDHFKLFNDRYGHSRGDVVLRQLGVLLGVSCRQQDLPARVGGEEFALILPDTDETGAKAMADKIMDALATMAMEHAASPTAPVVTVSIGTSTWSVEQVGGAETMYAQADKALYAAKNLGRNRACAYGSPYVPSL